jgi:hypothetical protein
MKIQLVTSVARVLSPEALVLGLSYVPAMHT